MASFKPNSFNTAAYQQAAQRATRAYRFTTTQPSWIARATISILLILIALIILPLLLLAVFIFLLLVLATTIIASFKNLFTPASNASAAHDTAGRKNVRVVKDRR